MRFFVLGVLLISPAAWPAVAYSFPAVSVQHLLTDKDCETVPDLLGDWEARGNLRGIWAMQKLGDRKYRLIEKRSEPGNPDKGAFDICLAHLGGYLFFDATSQKVRSDGNAGVFNEEEDFWIPLHVFGRLEAKDDRLNFLLLEDSWLQDELGAGRLRLTCSQDDEGQYVLTAPSKELKLFASHYARDPKAFSYIEDFRARAKDGRQEREQYRGAGLQSECSRWDAGDFSSYDRQETLTRTSWTLYRDLRRR